MTDSQSKWVAFLGFLLGAVLCSCERQTPTTILRSRGYVGLDTLTIDASKAEDFYLPIEGRRLIFVHFVYPDTGDISVQTLRYLVAMGKSFDVRADKYGSVILIRNDPFPTPKVKP